MEMDLELKEEKVELRKVTELPVTGFDSQHVRL